MIKLSKRLLTIASFVRENAKIVDVGCDHALLDIYLKEKYPNLKAIAADVREGALNQARQNLTKYNMEDDINLRMGDGLDVIDKDEIDTVIISGLGCPKIIEILTKDKSKLNNVTDLIIQSNTDFNNLRKKICSLGYHIQDELLIKENDIIYLIIHFQKGVKKYNSCDYLWGPILRVKRGSLYEELLQNDLNKKEILYSLIPPKHFLRKQQVRADITKIEKEIKGKN